MRLLAGMAAAVVLLALLGTPAPARTGRVQLGTAVGGPDCRPASSASGCARACAAARSW